MWFLDDLGDVSIFHVLLHRHHPILIVGVCAFQLINFGHITPSSRAAIANGMSVSGRVQRFVSLDFNFQER